MISTVSFWQGKSCILFEAQRIS